MTLDPLTARPGSGRAWPGLWPGAGPDQTPGPCRGPERKLMAWQRRIGPGFPDWATRGGQWPNAQTNPGDQPPWSRLLGSSGTTKGGRVARSRRPARTCGPFGPANTTLLALTILRVAASAHTVRNIAIVSANNKRVNHHPPPPLHVFSPSRRAPCARAGVDPRTGVQEPAITSNAGL